MKIASAASLYGEHLQERGLRDELTDEAQLPGVDPGAQASAPMKFDDVYLMASEKSICCTTRPLPNRSALLVQLQRLAGPPWP